MEPSLEFEIRDLFYEIMTVLQDSNNSASKIKIGTKITQELHFKLQSHPEYHDRHLPYINAATGRVTKKIAMEREEASITAELVARIDQFLPGGDETSEAEPF